MASILTVSVGHLSSPSSDTWNNLIKGLIVPGIYNGGTVIPSAGLGVLIEPFIIRTENHTIRLEGDWYFLNVPDPGDYLVTVSAFRSNSNEDEPLISLKAIAEIENDFVTLATLRVPVGTLSITASMLEPNLTNNRSLDSSIFYNKLLTGSGTFKDDATITHNLNHLKYTPLVFADESISNVGNITFSKNVNNFVVSNTGTARTSFSWVIINNSNERIIEGAVYGQIVVTNNTYELTHNLGNLNYFPVITPLETQNSSFWVQKGLNNITVVTESNSFRAIWAVLPTQGTHINGQANWNDSTISHGLGHSNYRIFHIPLANGPKTPTFIRNDNDVTINTNLIDIVSPTNLVWKDSWLNTVAYQLNEIVGFGNTFYVSTTNAPWTWRNTWSAGSSYIIDDIVEYENLTYIALTSSINITPNDNGINWQRYDILTPSADKINFQPWAVITASSTASIAFNNTTTWVGDWSSPTNYNVGDFVRHNGAYYLSNASQVGVNPSLLSGWDLIALSEYVTPFQYLILEDNNALTGFSNFGSKINHNLNTADYIPLISSTTPNYTAVTLAKNSMYINSGLTINYAVIPAASNWALGEWTRPSLSPVAPRIEYIGRAENGVHNAGDVFARYIATQNNFISKVLIQLYAPIPETFNIFVSFRVNGIILQTIAIIAGRTNAVKIFSAIEIKVNDLIEIVLISDASQGEILCTWFGQGDLALYDNAFEDPAFSAVNIMRLKLSGVYTGQTIIPVAFNYVVGSNNLFVYKNEKLVPIDAFTETNINEVVLADPLVLTDEIELVIFFSIHPTLVPTLLPDLPFTALHESRILALETILINELATPNTEVNDLHTHYNTTLANYTGDLPLARITGAGTSASYDVGILQNQIPVIGPGDVLPSSILPSLAIVDVYPVNNLADVVTLTAARQGDVAITNTEGTWILTTNTPNVLADWKLMVDIPDAVTSVAGKIGVVTLNSADITDFSTAVYNTNTIITGNIIATNGQTLISVGTYVLGNNKLKIYRNGVRQSRGHTYNETTTTSITFSSALNADDHIFYEIYN